MIPGNKITIGFFPLGFTGFSLPFSRPNIPLLAAASKFSPCTSLKVGMPGLLVNKACLSASRVVSFKK